MCGASWPRIVQPHCMHEKFSISLWQRYFQCQHFVRSEKMVLKVLNSLTCWSLLATHCPATLHAREILNFIVAALFSMPTFRALRKKKVLKVLNSLTCWSLLATHCPATLYVREILNFIVAAVFSMPTFRALRKIIGFESYE